MTHGDVIRSMTDDDLAEFMTEVAKMSAEMLCKSLKTVAIPGTVSRIAPKAFQRCKKLTKLSLEEGTAVIGEAAFAACVASDEARSAVKSIKAPEARRDLTYGGVGLAFDF